MTTQPSINAFLGLRKNASLASVAQAARDEYRRANKRYRDYFGAYCAAAGQPSADQAKLRLSTEAAYDAEVQAKAIAIHLTRLSQS